MTIPLTEITEPNQLTIPKKVKILTHTLLQEQKKPGLKKPVIEAKVYPFFAGVKRLVWTNLHSDAEPNYPHALAIDGQGSLHRIRNYPISYETSQIHHQKVTNPGLGSNFSIWNHRGYFAQPGYQPAICAHGSEICIFYREYTTEPWLTLIRSTDYGATWSYQSWGANPFHCAADFKPNGDIFVCYTTSSPTIAIKRRLSGVWQADQTSPWTFQELYGVAVKYHGDWNLIITAKKDNAFKLFAAIYGDGFRLPTGTWGQLQKIISIPEGQGYQFQFPFLSKPDSFLLSVVEKYTGTEATTRPYLGYSLKQSHFHDNLWREFDPFNSTNEYGLALASYGDYAWAATSSAVWRAYIPNQPLDLSPDIIRLEEEITPNQAQLTIELDNSSGKYNRPGEGALSALNLGSEIRLNLGYYTTTGKETIETNHYWLEAYHHHTAPNTRTLILNAINPWGLLYRWTPRHTLRWNNTRTIYQILQAILAKIGIPLNIISTSPTALGFEPDFSISPGGNGLHAIRRLLDMVTDVLIFSQGQAYLVDLAQTTLPVYHYGNNQHPIIEADYTINAPDINCLQVIGRSGATDIVVNDFNWQDINLVGERLDIEADLNLTTLTQARDRAQARLKKHQLTRHRAKITTQPNFAQELYDIVQLQDPIAPIYNANYRVIALNLTYNPQTSQLQSNLSLAKV